MRISATNLESFRRWREDESASVEDLLDYLRKKTPPTEVMRAGSALHKVLEHAKAGDSLNEVEQDGFRFRFKFDGEIALPALRELKLERQITVDGESHTVVAVVDTFGGIEIGDHKMTSRADAENYAPSIQWRAYLSWFEADVFVYNLFQASSPADEPGVYVISDFVPVTFCRYPGMDDEVGRLVRDFAEFCREFAPDLYNNERKAA